MVVQSLLKNCQDPTVAIGALPALGDDLVYVFFQARKVYLLISRSCLSKMNKRKGDRNRRDDVNGWAHQMDKGFERELKRRVKPFLDNGRSGDYEHTLRAVGYGKELLNHEEGEEGIVIPALYLHDIGWGKVDFQDFINVASPSRKKDAASVELHMKRGAGLAKRILEELDYDVETTQTIVSIIAVHDRPEKIFAMKNPSATLVLEADYLDKFGAKSLYRFDTMFKSKPIPESAKADGAEHLREGLRIWFRTRTGKHMALQLAKETGLHEVVEDR